MDLKARIAKNVRQIRKRLGITQQELADRINMTNRYLSLIENNPQNISVDVLQLLAKAQSTCGAFNRCRAACADGRCEHFIVEFDRVVKELTELRDSLDSSKLSE